ncbi:MAG: rhomboid family intramembrane serine protease [candidate division WOR-3 bacterium]
MFPISDDIPSKRKPFVMWIFIIICVMVFLIQTEGITQMFGFIPVKFWFRGEWIQTITYIFLHGNLFHLLGNMYYLYIFGDNVEDKLGRFGFALLFILSGIGGALLHGIFYPYSHIPLVGASGAISGVLSAYMIMFPTAGIYTYVFWYLVKVPAIIFIGFWVVMNYIYALSGVEVGVAWWAHIGGFLVGIPFGVIGRLKMFLQGEGDEDIQLFT